MEKLSGGRPGFLAEERAKREEESQHREETLLQERACIEVEHVRAKSQAVARAVAELDGEE